jgi:hypothetical protein
VLKKYVTALSLAMVCSGALAAAQAQSGAQGQQPEKQPPSAQQPAEPRPTAPQPAQQAAATTTLTGCVYKEADVPGRAPNVAERAGVMEDYILAVAPGASSPGTAGAVGTSGAAAGAMYKLELIADEKLRAVVGKRVEVTGRVDSEAGDKTAARPASEADKAIGRDRVDLPEFEVVSMREVAGTCPPKPGNK